MGKGGLATEAIEVGPVSYTHLDVYKRQEDHLAILTASGTGICGAAAVMGISSQFTSKEGQEERDREDEVVAVAIVAILGTLFTLIEIGLKPLLHMTAVQFGVMTGGSLHEIAHAVAAGSAGGPVSLDTAIITKLSRVLLLAPAAIIIGLWYQRKQAKAAVSTNGEKGSLPIPVSYTHLGYRSSSNCVSKVASS